MLIFRLSSVASKRPEDVMIMTMMMMMMMMMMIMMTINDDNKGIIPFFRFKVGQSVPLSIVASKKTFVFQHMCPYVIAIMHSKMLPVR